MAKIDLLSQEWCDLVFEGKNKNYGAYELRAESGKRNIRALVIVIILCVLAIGIPLLIKLATPKGGDESMTEVVQLSKLQEAKVKDEHIVKKFEEKPKEVQQIKSSIKFTAPVIKRDDEVTEADEMKSQEELGASKQAIAAATVVGNDEVHGKNIDDIKEVITSQVEDKVYDVVEQMPQYPGGEDALLAYIAKHLRYPSIAQEQGITGKVILRFVVLGDGSVGTVTVVKKLDPACDRAAQDVVKKLKFIPGRTQGKAVSVWFLLPIDFSLD